MPHPIDKVKKAELGMPVPTKAEQQVASLNKSRGNSPTIRENGTNPLTGPRS